MSESSQQIFDSALSAAQRGDLDGARGLYRRLLEQQPDHADGLFALASLEIAAGRPGDAEILFRKLLELQPRSAEAYVGLARAMWQNGRQPGAERRLRIAIDLEPDSPLIWREAGILLGRMDHLYEAEYALIRSHRLAPDDARCLNGLGRVFAALGKQKQAEKALRQAIKLGPRLASPRFELAALLKNTGQLAEAFEWLEEGHRLNPSDGRGLHLLGQIYLEQGLIDAAVGLLEKAAAALPTNTDVLVNLGLARQTVGNMKDVETCYRSALKIDPQHIGALRGMGRLLELDHKAGEGIALLSPFALSSRPDGELLAIFGRLLQQDGRGDEACELLESNLKQMGGANDRIYVLFQLAAFHDAAGRWDRAFDCCEEANSLKKTDFDPVRYRLLVDRLLQAFDEQTLRGLPRAGNEDTRPVLIVGMPRSGTSLVEQIVASHPMAHGAGELRDIGHHALATARDELEYPESATRLDSDTLTLMADDYLKRLDEFAPQADRVTDKMWQNFEFLGLASLMLPAARVIHCQRDALDTGVSCYFQHFFGSGAPFIYDLGHIGAYYREYQRIMEHWDKVLDLPMLTVHYEQLVREPENEIRRLLNFLDLPWDDACLRFHETERVVGTASYAQVKRPLYESSIGRHKHYADRLGPMNDALAGKN
ncbi:MAG: tetratricopeptide repeat-containing sulfotransferase family protein [Gammaproteobacteria bacterium]